MLRNKSFKVQTYFMEKKGASLAEFELHNGEFVVSEEVKKAFDDDGAFIVRKFLSDKEIANIWKVLEGDDNLLLKSAYDLPDGSGRASRLVLWNQPGTDFSGILARSKKMAGSCEELLRGEVYHYHTKVMMKEAKTGGSHLWHQDYGYWYKNGNLKPDMMTIFIALDPCNKLNGGLEVIKATHKCGRIDHSLFQGQTMADLERVQEIKKQFEHICVDLNPGDALFFHCNILHTSGPNDSDVRRYAYLVAYNRADNDPILKHHHPNYIPLEKVPNSAILECTNFSDFSGKELMDPKMDKTTKVQLLNTNFH